MKKLLQLVGLLVFVIFNLSADPITIAAPHFENFDGAGWAHNQPPANGWDRIMIGTGSNVVIIQGANALSPQNFARLTATTGTAILVTPEVINLGSTQATFWVRIAQAAPFPDLVVGVMSDNTDASTFVAVQTITGLNQTYQEFVVDFTGFGHEGSYIAFRHGNLSTSKNILIDDFSLETVATEPLFSVTPMTKDFGLVGIGENYQSQPQDFIISNAGIGTLEILSAEVTGVDVNCFIVVDEPQNYPVFLDGGQSLVVSIVFSPETIGTKQANLVITDNMLSREEHTVPLIGEGFVRPDGSTCIDPLVVNLPLIDLEGELTDFFGNDYSSSWITPNSNFLNGNDFVYKFEVSEESYLTGSIAGPSTGLFILDQCPDPNIPAPVLAYAQGGSFSDIPLFPGEYFAIVSTSLNTPVTFTINLSLEDAGPTNLVISPTEKDFGVTVIGTERTQLFTISNTGSSDLILESISIAGINPFDFSITSQPESYPVYIPFAQSIDLVVAFIPATEGDKNADVVITHNLGSPEMITLSGYGFKQFDGGNGSFEHPFEVNNAQQLDQIREYLGPVHTSVYFLQTADIDLGGTLWQPLGTSTTPFYGNYDGNHYAINSLTFNTPSADNAGLFGYINNAYLTRVRVTDANIVANNFAGIIVGTALNSILESCYTTGFVQGFNNIGGIVGISNGSFITTSFSGAEVRGVNSVGGIVGTQNSTMTPALSNCFVAGSIVQTAVGNWIGGLVGANWSGNVLNCYSIASVSGTGVMVGGLIGNSLGSTITSYYNTDLTPQTDSNRGLPRNTLEMTYPYAENTYVDWDFETIWAADPAGNTNDGYPYLRSLIVPDSQTEPDAEDTNVLIAEDSPIPVTLPNTGITIDFGGTNPEQTITSLFFGFQPDGVMPDGISNISPAFWTITSSSATPGDYYITFDLSGIPGIQSPETLYLLKRDSSEEMWVSVGFPIPPVAMPLLSWGPLNSFSDFALGGDETNTLPVELSSFTANVTSNLFVELKWITETETNMLGYNIYRSGANDFNKAYVISPIIIPANNSSVTQEYSFSDSNVSENQVYFYWLQTIDLDLTTSFHGPISVNVSENQELPETLYTTRLNKNFPNPFNPETIISFSLRDDTHLELAVYNILGQIVRTLHSGPHAKGEYQIVWDGKSNNGNNVSSGVFFLRMTTQNFDRIQKMMLLK